MGACLVTELPRIEEHRVGIEPTSPRYDGGILPLDHQCLLSVGPEGVEPSPVWLRASDAAITPQSQVVVLEVGAEGVEPTSDPYKRPALTVELRARK